MSKLQSDRAINTKNGKCVAVVTDSISQLPMEMTQELNITVIPLTININGKPYFDGIDLTSQEIYHRMRCENIVPTTTSPSPAQYQKVFEHCFASGYESVLCITLSSKLSMGYSSACLAAEKTSTQFPDRAIEVLDSRKAAIAEGFVVIRAAKSAAAGKHLPEVLQAAREACRKTNIVATLDTIEYLERGRTIEKLNLILGSLIDIRPIISIDVDGDLKPLRKVRGESQSLEAIVDQVVEDVSGCEQLHLAVIAADAPEKAERLKALALEKLEPDEIFYTELTPVMGVHAGPGSLGLGYYYT